MTTTFERYLRVDVSVGHVNREVGNHEDHCDDEDKALNHGVIAIEQLLNEEVSDAWTLEDDLHDHRSV